VFSGEAAAQVGSFFAQAEYFDYRIKRLAGLPDLHFNGDTPRPAMRPLHRICAVTGNV